jgi:DNA repair protein RadC
MLPLRSTWMFANNIYNLRKYLVKDNKIALDRKRRNRQPNTAPPSTAKLCHAGAREAMGILIIRLIYKQNNAIKTEDYCRHTVDGNN